MNARNCRYSRAGVSGGSRKTAARVTTPRTPAEATATPAQGAAPLPVAFDVEATDPDGDDLSYAWDFGVAGTDADTSDQRAPAYTYAQPGTYTAS